MKFRANHEPELLTDRISDILSCILLIIGRILMIIFILIAFASTVKAATRPTTTKSIVSVSTTQAVKGKKKAKQPGSVTGTKKPSKSNREELRSPSQSKKKTKNQEIEIVPPAPTEPKPKKASAKSSETKKSPNAVIATKNNRPAEVIQSVEPVNSPEESSTEKNSTTESSLKYVEPADVSSDSEISTKDTSPASSTPKIDYDLDPFILSSVFDLKNYIGQFVALNPNYTISFDSSHHIMRLQRNDPKSQQAGVESMTISLVGDLETNNPNPVSITILGITSNDNPSLKYRRVYIMPNVWGELIRIDGVDEYFYTAEAVVLKDVLAAMVEHPTGDDITENGLSPLYPSLQSTKFQE